MAPHAIERLRKCGQAPTRVEAVSELVWGCLNRVRGNIAGSMMTSVNIRRKMTSPGVSVSDCSMGNLWTGAVATVGEGVRSAVRRVDEGYVRVERGGGLDT